MNALCAREDYSPVFKTVRGSLSRVLPDICRGTGKAMRSECAPAHVVDMTVGGRSHLLRMMMCPTLIRQS